VTVPPLLAGTAPDKVEVKTFISVVSCVGVIATGTAEPPLTLPITVLLGMAAEPAGTTHVPSALRKLTVPPPLAGTVPERAIVKIFINAVNCSLDTATGMAVIPLTLPSTVLLAIGAWDIVTPVLGVPVVLFPLTLPLITMPDPGVTFRISALVKKLSMKYRNHCLSQSFGILVTAGDDRPFFTGNTGATIYKALNLQ
jgi:hypothetical protein